MIVLVHSGIASPEMWNGFELPGETRRHRLDEPLSVDAPAARWAHRTAVSSAWTSPRGTRELVTDLVLLIRVLQDGAAIARLRLAGRGDPVGQFSRCRFKKLSTAL